MQPTTSGRVVHGPWTVRATNVDDPTEEIELWGIGSVEFEVERDSIDVEDIHGLKVEIPGSLKTGATFELNRTDVQTLRSYLGQHWVPQGGTLSSGETVLAEEGAIDIVPSGCEVEAKLWHIEFISCSTPRQVKRLLYGKFDYQEESINGAAERTTTVKLTSQPPAGVAPIQYYAEGGISIVTS